MSDEVGPLADRTVDLARLSPLLVAFGFFAVATMRAMNLGVFPALETLVVGWLLVVPPMAAVVWTLVGRPAFVPWPFEDDAAVDRDPLEELRDRYARGELTEAEFEERVDGLLETEAGAAPDSSATGARPASADEREPSVERE